MRFSASTFGFSLLFCGVLALPPTAQAFEDRTAEVILKEIAGVKAPDIKKLDRSDEAAVKAFIAERKAAMTKKAELITELSKVDPGNDALAELMPERWQTLLMGSPEKQKAQLKTLKDESSAVLAHTKNEKFKTEAAYFYAIATLRDGDESDEKSRIAAADSFIKLAPKDERGSILLFLTADEMEDGPARSDMLKRVLKDYPKSQFARMVEGALKQLARVGEPFALEFTDAIKGTEVSMKTTLKGKVVVVDFCATWCGPCVEEMPNMKKLYAEFHDKGVEFVGVSLDAPKEDGGLEDLKQFVAKNEIAWPQYYQGKGGESEFSNSWEVNSIPTLFVVDADGKLFSVNARGKLDKMLPALLKKAKADSGAAGGGN